MEKSKDLYSIDLSFKVLISDQIHLEITQNLGEIQN
jgi:hypothetical protein